MTSDGAGQTTPDDRERSDYADAVRLVEEDIEADGVM
jgi:hypothetical protein